MSAQKKRGLLYMHTIDGQPALYWPGHQICYCNRIQRNAPPLATSLAQIRREQRATKRYRKAWGFVDEAGKYSYVHVGTEIQPKAGRKGRK